MSATSNLGNLGPSQFGQFGQYTVDSNNPFYCTPLKRTPVTNVSADSAGNITYTLGGSVIENDTQVFESDYSSGGSQPFAFNVNLTINQEVSGVVESLEVEAQDFIGNHYIQYNQSLIVPSGDLGTPKYNLSFDYYISPTNTNINGIELDGFTSSESLFFENVDSWTSVSLTNLSAESTSNFQIYGVRDQFRNFDGNLDTFYIKNVVLTRVDLSIGSDLSQIIKGSKAVIKNSPSEQNNGVKFITNVIDSANSITVSNDGLVGVDETSDKAVLEIHAPKTIGVFVNEDLTVSTIEFGNNQGGSASTAGYTAGTTKVGDIRKLTVSAGTAELYLAPDFLSPEEV